MCSYKYYDQQKQIVCEFYDSKYTVVVNDAPQRTDGSTVQPCNSYNRQCKMNEVHKNAEGLHQCVFMGALK